MTHENIEMRLLLLKMLKCEKSCRLLELDEGEAGTF